MHWHGYTKPDVDSETSLIQNEDSTYRLKYSIRDNSKSETSIF